MYKRQGKGEVWRDWES